MQHWPFRALPANKNPIGTRCIQIDIPNDDDWERAMYAEVATLAQWMRWERDLGHNGKPVADIWLAALRTWRHCDGSISPIHGITEDFELPLRVDCDCNVFVTCCDGTEKQILTSDQVKALISGQPTDGTPVPPAGGCKTYEIEIEPGKASLVAPIVNENDVLTLHDLVGSTTDAAPVGRWNCPDGGQFFGGACVGFPFIDATAPIPSQPIGIPLFVIAGNYYDARIALTVPGGISNEICAVVINYAAGGSYSGKLNGTLEVCNNQAPTWTHTFDFTLSTNGWRTFTDADNPAGEWIPGTGWHVTDFTNVGGSPFYRGVRILINALSAHAIFGASVTFDLTKGVYDLTTGDGLAFDAFNPGAVGLIGIAETGLVNGSGQTIPVSHALTNVQAYQIVLITDNDPSSFGPFTGDAVIKSITINGTGPQPVWP